MLRPFILLGLISVVALTGCATESQILDGYQGRAIQTVSGKAQFEMNCRDLTPVISSRKLEQAAATEPWRANYTIDMEGCGKKARFLVICPEGQDSCISTDYRQFNK